MFRASSCYGVNISINGKIAQHNYLPLMLMNHNQQFLVSDADVFMIDLVWSTTLKKG